MNIFIWAAWEPLTLYLSKSLMMSLVNLVLLPFSNCHLGSKPVIVPDSLCPISLMSACWPSSRALTCLPSIPGAQVSLSLSWTDASTCQSVSLLHFPLDRAVRTSFQSQVLVLSSVCSETLKTSPRLANGICDLLEPTLCWITTVPNIVLVKINNLLFL